MDSRPELICVCGHSVHFHPGGHCTFICGSYHNNDVEECECVAFLNKNAPLVPVKKKKPKKAYTLSLDMSPGAVRDRKIVELEKRIKALEGMVFGGLDKV